MLKRPIVVVLFGSAAPEWCDLSNCPMSAHLFETDAEADAFMDQQPEWTQPHRLLASNWQDDE